MNPNFKQAVGMLLVALSLGSVANFSFAAGDKANREEDVKDRFHVENKFFLPMPKKAPSPKACPDCHSIILADDRELLVTQGRGRYIQRKLIALLKPEAFEQGEFRTPIIYSNSKDHYFLSARVMTPSGEIIEAQDKDIHMELVGGREKDKEGSVRFVISMPGLAVGGVLQLEIAQEFTTVSWISASGSGKAHVSYRINDIYEFGDGESPVLNSRLTITGPKNAKVNFYTYPEKGWVFKNHGQLYRGQSRTISYRYGTFEPTTNVSYLPDDLLTHPTLILHLTSNKADRFYTDEEANTWQQMISENAKLHKEFFNSEMLPKEIRKLNFSGANPAQRAESLRLQILANQERILGGKLPERALDEPWTWFLGMLTQKKVPFSWVWAKDRSSIYDANKVAEASVDNLLVKFQGASGPVFMSPFEMRYPPGSLPSRLLDGVFYECPNGTEQVTKGFLPAPRGKVASREYSLKGIYSFEGGLEGQAKVSYGGVLEGSQRNRVSNWEGKDFKRNVESSLHKRNESLSVDNPVVDSPDGSFKEQGFSMEASVTLEEWGLDSGDELVITPLLFSPEPPNSSFLAKRKFPVEWNYPEVIKETLSIELPAGYVLENEFETVSFDHEDLSFSLEVHQQGNTLVVHRKLEYKTMLVPLERYQTLRKDLAKIAQAERMEIILTIE